MRFQREHEFDRYFAAASAAVGLPPALMKAIVAIETEFNNNPFNSKPGKYGLAGMTIEITKRMLPSLHESDPRIVRDPQAGILLLAHYLRFLYSHLANKQLFPEQEGNDPDMHDVIKQFARDNKSGNPVDYHRKVWEQYMYFSQKSGEPEWTSPDQVDGVYIRKRQRESYL